jgi:hypothetical protein
MHLRQFEQCESLVVLWRFDDDIVRANAADSVSKSFVRVSFYL